MRSRDIVDPAVEIVVAQRLIARSCVGFAIVQLVGRRKGTGADRAQNPADRRTPRLGGQRRQRCAALQ